MKTYNVKPEEVQVTDDITITAVSLGEKGRGRSIVNVACPESFLYLEEGQTKKGKVRLNNSHSDRGWILRISTAGAYIRGANGNVSTHPEDAEAIRVLARGQGAFGAAGRTGNWDDLLITTELEEFLLRVKPSRGDAYIIWFREGKVSELDYDQAELADLDLMESSPRNRGKFVRL